MRILTFNVNSLQRLLNHPLHHILKPQQQSTDSQPTSTSHAASTGEGHPNNGVNSQLDDAFDGSFDDPFDDAFMAEDDFPFSDEDEEEDIDEDASIRSSMMMKQQQQQQQRLSPAVAVPPAHSSSATTVVPNASPSSNTNTNTSAPPLPRPSSYPLQTSQPLRQSDIDALDSSLARAARERAAHEKIAAPSPAQSAAVSSRLAALLTALKADIICLQEVKLSRLRLTPPIALVEGWDAFFSFSRRRQGYSGVVTYCRSTIARPIRAEEGFTGMLAEKDAVTATSSSTSSSSSSVPVSSSSSIGEYAQLYAEFDANVLKELDSEGRCVMTDHGQFVLINCYFPNAAPDDSSRKDFKGTFYRAMQLRAEALVRAGRHVVIVGDVNACHTRMDHCDYTPATSSKEKEKAKANGQAGEEEEDEFEFHASRKWLHEFLVDGGGMFVDVFRTFFPTRTKAYTCWNTKTGARLSNYGTRIDYILADVDLYESGFFTRCDIRPDVFQSDHCPVEADFTPETLVTDPSKQPPPLCSKFMPEFSGSQQSIQSFFSKGAATAVVSASQNNHLAADSVAGVKRHFSETSTPTSSSSTSSIAASFNSTLPLSKRAKNSSSVKKGASAAASSMKLSAFFTTKTKATSSATKEIQEIAPPVVSSQSSASSAVSSPPATFASTLPSPPSASSSALSNSEAFVSAATFATQTIPNADPAASVNKWKLLLNQKAHELRCNKHNLRCKLFTVGKPGVNHGREFYMCSLVPPDRCNFFQWKSELKSESKNQIFH